MPALFDRKSGNCLILAMLMAFGLGTSCSDENLVNDMQGKEQLSFGVSISDKWNMGGTRSAEDEETVSSTKIENSDLWLITTVEDNPDTTLFMQPEEETRGTTITKTNFYNSFGVYAYTYTGTWATANDKKLYIDGDEVEQAQESSIWITKPSRFWPGDAYTMKFFAFAPYDIKDKFSVNGGKPTISYTVNADAKNHKDILFASTIVDENDKEKDIEEVPGNYHNTLNLRFRHLLTAINVEVSDPLNRKIKSVKFTGVHASGNYTYGGVTWNKTEKADKEISCDVDVDLSGSTPDNPTEVIKDDNGTTFMMIPQTLGSEAKIGVTLTDQEGENEKTLWANLTGEWQMGKKVTYIISAVNAILEVELAGNFEDYEYYGGSKFFTVKSYMTTGTDVEPAAWIAEFSEDGGATYSKTPPSCLVDFKTSGDGSKKVNETIEHEVCTAKVAAQIGNVSNQHNKELRGKKSINETSGVTPYDLSTKGGTADMNTANCYIINAPGTYSFPLVYGNARKNGADYSAYTTTVSGDVLKTFLNHNNSPIQSPWIAKDKYSVNGEVIVPDNAFIVWQDVLNLVTNVRLEGKTAEEYRIVFDVAKDNIQQGNAVIAVRDAKNTILWSWHIWVTDYVPELSPTITSTYDSEVQQYDKTVQSFGTPSTYIFMGVPLGFCDDEETEYKPREVKILIKQTNNSKMFKGFTVKQIAYKITTGNNAPYYQWGRKDPMLPSNGISGNKTYYDSTCTPSNTVDVANDWSMSNVISNGISNPHKFCLTIGMDNTYCNLWDLNRGQPASDTYVYGNINKTIYDPSPVGYVVPPSGAFSFFTWDATNGGTVNSQLAYNNGWSLYCYKNKNTSGGIIYFPAFNERWYESGGVAVIGGYARYLSAIPFRTDDSGLSHAQSIYFDSNDILPYYSYWRSHGITMRPVKQ